MRGSQAGAKRSMDAMADMRTILKADARWIA